MCYYICVQHLEHYRERGHKIMAQYGYSRKKRYKIKYKNLAILLAIFLIILLLFVKCCSAVFSGKDKDDDNPNRDNPVSSGDIVNNDLPIDPITDGDPTTQNYYYFTSESRTSADLGTGNLALVNNNIMFLGTVTEDDLVVVFEKKNNAYKVKDYTVMIKPVAMDALNDMLLAFNSAKGNNHVMVNSGYRTPEEQGELYQKELNKTGQDYSTLVARAGYSEHHTGLVVDFTTDYYNQSDIGTGDYAWINENCYKYGYINRYPEGKESLTLIDNEPWHFRYVGIPHATVMHDRDLCLEEYIDYLKNFTINTGFLSVTTEDGSQYIIFYVPQKEGAESTAVYVPLTGGKDSPPYPYEISGNNVDGWIVTFLFKEGTGVQNAPPVVDPDVPDVTDPDDANNDDNAGAEE